jgi:aspartate aminotransferase-like enzyme
VSHPLLDIPPINARRFAALEDRVAALLGTDADVVLLQAEATVALEAVALGLGRTGVTVLNVVSGPYGGVFGSWLRSTGATVVDVAVPFDGAVTPEEVGRILKARPEIVAVSMVHAEAATGNKSALASVAEVIRDHGALLVVDAVAAVGAEPLLVDRWGIDVCVIGPQKALAGPAGVSCVAVSDRAWNWLEANHQAPRHSALSLLDWKHAWIDSGRRSLPVIPSTLDLLALEAALVRIAAEGHDATIARHRAAATAARVGLRALGLEPWVARDDEAAHVVTTVRKPGNRSAGDVLMLLDPLRPPLVTPGVGALSEVLLRINHTGRAANPAAVTDALEDVFTITLGRRPHAGVEGKQLVTAQRRALEAWDAALHDGAARDDGAGADRDADSDRHTDADRRRDDRHADAARRGLARTA